MVPIVSLWAPILLSAVLVFVASAIIHMVLTYHRSDFRKVPSEDAVMDTLRRAGIPPGNYMMPHAKDMKEWKEPAFMEKRKQGPIATLTVMKDASMGVSLAQWFVYCVVVGVFVAYIAGRALEPRAEYLAVFRFAGATASRATRSRTATTRRRGRTPRGPPCGPPQPAAGRRPVAARRPRTGRRAR